MTNIAPDYRQVFADYAARQLHAPSVASPNVAAAIGYVFTESQFAARTGNYGVASAVLALAAAKLVNPDLDVTLMSDVEKPNGYPTLRNLQKVSAGWVRRNIDPALMGADPGAGMRRSLMHPSPFDDNYGGHFSDPALREKFIALVKAMQEGQAREVFDATLHGYRQMADSRLPIASVAGPVDRATAQAVIARFLNGDGGNRGERMQAVVWAVAHESDPRVAWNKALTTNDHAGVADIDGPGYAVEVTAGFVRLNKAQDVCAKARRSGSCERVLIVSAETTACRSEAELADIKQVIKRQYPDIDMRIETLTTYLDRMVNGFGRCTWDGVLARIARAVQNLQPLESNCWNGLIAEMLD